MRFSYDEVEDIRLAVGEACTSVLDRIEGHDDSPPIQIRCLIDPGRLTVEVTDSVPTAARKNALPTEGSLPDDVQLGGVLIRILMDEVTAEEDLAVGTH